MSKKLKHTILLGGLGGDSHSVGISILRRALVANGFRVLFLGIQNRIESFFLFAPDANAVLVSNLDGHALHYLRQFSDLKRSPMSIETRWYIGGNLTIGDGFGYEKRFLDMGFDRAFVKFVDIELVLGLLKQDLSDVIPRPYDEEERAVVGKPLSHQPVLNDEKVDDEDLIKARKEVLQQWPTGHDARDMDEVAGFAVGEPTFAQMQKEVLEGKRGILVQPRSGVALVDKQIGLFNVLKAGGADVLSFQVDSHTRNNAYSLAHEAILESTFSDDGVLNGFPVVNHGVSKVRRILKSVGVPLQTRHSTRDPRLLAEISIAGGVSAFEGGAICYNVPYYKDYPLTESIPNWQYVDRLVGLYFDKYGLIIDREFFGTLTATLIPPCIAIAVCVLEGVLAAAQGVQSVSLGYAEQGNRVQDIAAIQVMKEVGQSTFRSLGFDNVQVNTVYHQYMAAFPADPSKAEELILQSACTGALSGATRMLIKTPVEAFKIPTAQDNLHGLSLVRRGIALAESMPSHNFIDTGALEEEAARIRRSAVAIIESVFAAGKGELANGIALAFSKGLLDIPFAASIYNYGKVVTVRDVSGAVRFADCGNLALPSDIVSWHKERITERRRKQHVASSHADYQLVEMDVLQIARGQYERWPLE